MRRRPLLALSLVTLVAGLILSLVDMPGSASAARAEESAKLHTAVQQVMTKLRKNTKGLRPGITYAEAAKATRGAAQIVGGFSVSLAKTSYAPDGDWQGVISFYADLDAPRETLEDFDLALLCGAYDKLKMERWLLDVVGPALGLALAPDDEQKYLYWDPEATGRDVWISLGDGVIQFSTTLIED